MASYANVQAPRGFTIAQLGGKRAAKSVPRPVAASRAHDLRVGDAYTLATGDHAVRAIGTSTVRGIVLGIDVAPIPADPQGPVSQQYILAADAGAIFGVEDPDTVLAVQIDTAAETDVGSSVYLIDPGDESGSLPLTQSRQYVSLADPGAGVLNFKLLGLLRDNQANAWGAWAWVLVRPINTL